MSCPSASVSGASLSSSRKTEPDTTTRRRDRLAGRGARGRCGAMLARRAIRVLLPCALALSCAHTGPDAPLLSADAPMREVRCKDSAFERPTFAFATDPDATSCIRSHDPLGCEQRMVDCTEPRHVLFDDQTEEQDLVPAQGCFVVQEQRDHADCCHCLRTTGCLAISEDACFAALETRESIRVGETCLAEEASCPASCRFLMPASGSAEHGRNVGADDAG